MEPVLIARPNATERWCAVYGALVAAYIFSTSKTGAVPNEDDMLWIIKNAENMADYVHGVHRLMEEEAKVFQDIATAHKE